MEAGRSRTSWVRRARCAGHGGVEVGLSEFAVTPSMLSTTGSTRMLPARVTGQVTTRLRCRSRPPRVRQLVRLLETHPITGCPIGLFFGSFGIRGRIVWRRTRCRLLPYGR